MAILVYNAVYKIVKNQYEHNRNSARPFLNAWHESYQEREIYKNSPNFLLYRDAENYWTILSLTEQASFLKPFVFIKVTGYWMLKWPAQYFPKDFPIIGKLGETPPTLSSLRWGMFGAIDSIKGICFNK